MNTQDSFNAQVNKTMLDYCLTIPKALHCKLDIESIVDNHSQDVIILWDDERYYGKLIGKNILDDSTGFAYQLHFKKDMLKKISETFIQSYMAIRSQFYGADSNKQYRTMLPEECEEYINMTILEKKLFEFKVETQVKTPYDNIFRNLLNEDVFGWMGKSDKVYDKMITESSDWIPIKNLRQYSDVPYVVYYLVDENQKEIYIGSATRLGNRVKPVREEIPGWNKFRYEKIHKSFYGQLWDLEYHSIINFAKFFNNKGNKSNLGLSDYILVNKDYGYFRNK